MNNIKDYIIVENVIPKEICKSIITNINNSKSWEKHTWYDPRKNHSYSYDNKELDVLEIDQEISKILNPILNKALVDYVKKINIEGENTNKWLTYFTPVRFNKYGVGTKMRRHFDFIHSIFDGNFKGAPILSVVGILNDDYEGGEFVFNDKFSMTFKTGDILMFPSTFMYIHEVKEITKGNRYSFVSWAF